MGIDVRTTSTHYYPRYEFTLRNLPMRENIHADYFINDNGGELCLGWKSNFLHKEGIVLNSDSLLRFLRGCKYGSVISLNLHVDWWTK